MPKINPISAVPLRNVGKQAVKKADNTAKNVANKANHEKIDLSYEEEGYFKVGDRFVKIFFPR